MNRFSTLTAVIGIAAAATLAQPLAAQAGPTLHPVAGVLRSMPGMDPLPHGIVVDPIVGRQVLTTPNRETHGPIAPIQRAFGFGHGDGFVSPPVQRTPVSGTPVLHGGRLVGVGPFPVPRFHVIANPRDTIVPITTEKP